MTLPVLDRAHLDAATFGDADLAREVLGLFLEQCAAFPAALAAAGDAATKADTVHRLKGAARGIGAVMVAAAADTLEQALRRGDGGADASGLARAIADTLPVVAEAAAG